MSAAVGLVNTWKHFRACDQDALEEEEKKLGLTASFHFRLSPSDTLIQLISFLLLQTCVPQLLAATVYLHGGVQALVSL